MNLVVPRWPPIVRLEKCMRADGPGWGRGGEGEGEGGGGGGWSVGGEVVGPHREREATVEGRYSEGNEIQL